MEQSKLPGGGTNVGGWFSRQLRRVSSFIKENPLLNSFFGIVAGGLDIAASGFELFGLKTSTLTVDLTALEQQQLDNWANGFLAQLTPKLEEFARYNNVSDAQSKIDTLNDVYRQLGAIKAHFAAPSPGFSPNQLRARKQLVDELTLQLQLKVEFLTTELPVQISLVNRSFPVSSINTNGITANSPVATVTVRQISTQVKGSGGGSSWLDTVLPIGNEVATFNPDPTSPVKDITDPVKVDPAAPTTTPPKPTSNNKGLRILAGIATAAIITYAIASSGGNKNKKSKKK